MKACKFPSTWLFVIAAMVMPATAKATLYCTSSNDSTNNVGSPQFVAQASGTTVKINPNAPDGAVLAELEPTMYLNWRATVKCSGTASPTVTLITGLTYLGDNVYDTGVPGIGIRFAHPIGGWFPYEGTLNPGTYVPFPSKATLQLVKIGAIPAPGTLPTIYARTEIAEAGVGTNYLNVFTRFSIYGPKLEISIPTCQVTTPLVSVYSSQFTEMGSVSAASDLAIGVKCTGGAAGSKVAVHAVLTDQSDPENRDDALKLSADSTASGLGVQVLFKGNVIRFGPDSKHSDAENRWLAGTTGVGEYSIPLSARYVRTGSVVSAGTANARATFTLSYE
jgi:type 1 fimbria pilin